MSPLGDASPQRRRVTPHSSHRMLLMCAVASPTALGRLLAPTPRRRRPLAPLGSLAPGRLGASAPSHEHRAEGECFCLCALRCRAKGMPCNRPSIQVYKCDALQLAFGVVVQPAHCHDVQLAISDVVLLAHCSAVQPAHCHAVRRIDTLCGWLIVAWCSMHTATWLSRHTDTMSLSCSAAGTL